VPCRQRGCHPRCRRTRPRETGRRPKPRRGRQATTSLQSNIRGARGRVPLEPSGSRQTPRARRSGWQFVERWRRGRPRSTNPSRRRGKTQRWAASTPVEVWVLTSVRGCKAGCGMRWRRQPHNKTSAVAVRCCEVHLSGAAGTSGALNLTVDHELPWRRPSLEFHHRPVHEEWPCPQREAGRLGAALYLARAQTRDLGLVQIVP
jgi:hypothetical protein